MHERQRSYQRRDERETSLPPQLGQVRDIEPFDRIVAGSPRGRQADSPNRDRAGAHCELWAPAIPERDLESLQEKARPRRGRLLEGWRAPGAVVAPGLGAAVTAGRRTNRAEMEDRLCVAAVWIARWIVVG